MDNMKKISIFYPEKKGNCGLNNDIYFYLSKMKIFKLLKGEKKDKMRGVSNIYPF